MSEAVYLVSMGSYSDYRVLAVFTKKEDAEAAAAKINTEIVCKYDEAFVEERLLNPDVFYNERQAFSVDMELDSGNNAAVSRLDFCEAIALRDNTHAWGARGATKKFHTECFADDEAHAIKIANERRAQYKAMKGVEHE